MKHGATDSKKGFTLAALAGDSGGRCEAAWPSEAGVGELDGAIENEREVGGGTSVSLTSSRSLHGGSRWLGHGSGGDRRRHTRAWGGGYGGVLRELGHKVAAAASRVQKGWRCTGVTPL